MLSFGKIIQSVKYKKGEIGLDVSKTIDVLKSDSVENTIVLLEEGRTDKGYEFNTVTIFSKRKS